MQIQVSLNKSPYRGILKEIATELGITMQAVHQRRQHYNDEVLEMIARKVAERDEALTTQMQQINSARYSKTGAAADEA